MTYENKSDEANKTKGVIEARAVASAILNALMETAVVTNVVNNEPKHAVATNSLVMRVNGVEVHVLYCTEHKAYDSWNYHYTGHGEVSWYIQEATYRSSSNKKVSRGSKGHNVKLAVTNILKAVASTMVSSTAKDSSLACMTRIQESLGLKDGSVLRTTPVQDHVEIHLESLLVNEAQATAVLQVLLDQGLLDRYRR